MTASSATGDGVVIRDTEKRPCTLGVWPGLLTGVTVPLVDFLLGVSSLVEVDLRFGFSSGVACLRKVGDLAGVVLTVLGDAFGEVFLGVAGEGDLVASVDWALWAGDFPGDGVRDFGD